MSAPRRTLIRAGHVIGFDGHGHRLLRDGAVVLEGDRILAVGPRFEGRTDEVVDARDRVLTPGLISTHAHIAGSPLDRSFIEDTGRPQFYYSGLFEALPVRDGAQDKAAGRACVDFSMAELLRGGVTTVLEIGQLGDYVAERAAHYGLRVKNLVYNATAEDVDRVYVNGRVVVDGGRVLAADEGAILAALQAGGERMWPRMREFDWAGRDADALSPQTYPEWR